MDLELQDKVALITGSSRGLGGIIASSLHAEGCRVVLNGRDPSAVRQAVERLGARATGIAADVTDRLACDALVRGVLGKWGRLDVLVCNVGSGRSVAPGNEHADEWRRMLELNLLTATNAVEASASALSDARGSIVCISSICGLEALGAPVTYSAAKAALNAYVRGVARPLATRGVRVNAVAPGNLLFDGSVWAERLKNDPEGVQALLGSEVALGRLGRPQEIASFVAFLASSQSSFATGAVYVVDGGQLRS